MKVLALTLFGALLFSATQAAPIDAPEGDVSTPEAGETAPAAAEPSPFVLPEHPEVAVEVSVGGVNLDASKARGSQGRQVVFSKEIDVAQLQSGKVVDYARLVFDAEKTKLRSRPDGAKDGEEAFGINLPGDVLRIISLEDNEVQYLNAEALQDWNHHSAYFNGGKLRVELLVDGSDQEAFESAKQESPSFVISSVIVNDKDKDKSIPPPDTLCNRVDQRKQIKDLRSGRIFPVGCTGWIINDKRGCQLTAGHCFKGQNIGKQILELNVPNSDSNGGVKHPAVQFQFPVDATSATWALSGSEDYGYYGTKKNSNTGKTARETAKGSFTLAKVIKNGNDYVIDPKVGVKPGKSVRITGYGVVTQAGQRHKSQTEQTHLGPLVTPKDKYHHNYRVDTTGGNSGSPIVISDKFAIGIHTNGGCTPSNSKSSNWGSSIAMPGVQKALAAPKGVCK